MSRRASGREIQSGSVEVLATVRRESPLPPVRMPRERLADQPSYRVVTWSVSGRWTKTRTPHPSGSALLRTGRRPSDVFERAARRPHQLERRARESVHGQHVQPQHLLLPVRVAVARRPAVPDQGVKVLAPDQGVRVLAPTIAQLCGAEILILSPVYDRLSRKPTTLTPRSDRRRGDLRLCPRDRITGADSLLSSSHCVPGRRFLSRRRCIIP